VLRFLPEGRFEIGFLAEYQLYAGPVSNPIQAPIILKKKS